MNRASEAHGTISSVPQRVVTEGKIEKDIEEITAKLFPNLMKNINPQPQEAQSTSS